MQQHVFHDRVGALAVLRDFVEIRAQQICELGYFSSHIVVEFGTSKGLLQFIDQVDGNIREIVDEVEWILDLVRDTRCQLAQRGKLLGLDQSVLRSAQLIKRVR